MLKTGAGLADPELSSFERRMLSGFDPTLGLDRYADVAGAEAIMQRWAAATTPTARQEIAGQFFASLKTSVIKVKDFAQQLDGLASASRQSISQTSEESLSTPSALQRLIAFRIELQQLIHYRKLNCEAFRFLLERFLLVCAVDDLGLQKKVRQADDIIAKSNIQTPDFDAGEAADFVTSCYALANKVSFEEATRVMNQALAAHPDLQARLMPTSSAHYFHDRATHRTTQGRFGIRLIAGRTNPALVQRVEFLLQSRTVTKATLGSFANGEVSIRIDEAVRGDDVFVVQSLSPRFRRDDPTAIAGSMSEAIIELLLSVQTANLAAAKRCTVVAPYMAYTKHKSECAALAEMFATVGCHRLITVDMYKAQVEGFFSCPVENLTFRTEFIRYLVNQLRAQGDPMTNLCVVAPDSEAVGRSRIFADALMAYAELDEKKQSVGVATAVRRLGSDTIDVIGNVANKTCFIVDSVIDEALNVTNVAERLLDIGALRVSAVATHAVFSGQAAKRLAASRLHEVLVSDSIEHDALIAQSPALARKLRVLPMAPLIAEAMERIHTENTLSTLID